MGDVIDFQQAARERSWARTAREAQPIRDEFSHWYSDLARWPEVFRRRLRSKLDSEVEDMRQGDSASIFFGANIAECRMRVGGYSFGWFVRQLECNLQHVRCKAEELRDARARGLRPHVMRRREKDLECAKSHVLWLMWRFDVRKVQRSDIEPMALEDLAQERDDFLMYIGARERTINRLRSLCEGGRYQKGSKKGKRYSKASRTRIEAELARKEAALRVYTTRVAYIESEPDPLRSWGFYAQRREG